MSFDISRFFSDLYKQIREDNVFNGAAALAFYLTLAIFPTLIALMALIPYLPIVRVDEAIMDLLGQALPQRAADVVSSVVQEVVGERRGGLLTAGLAAAVWASSTGMYAIMQQMNIVYGVAEGRPFVRARVTALGLTLLFGVLILGAFTLVVLGGVIQSWLAERFGLSDVMLALFVVFRWAVIVMSLVLGIALIYHFAPNRRRPLALLTPGALSATVLLVGASLAFRFYVDRFGNYSATYGSIGAVIVLMLWLYLAGCVILVGAEVDAMREGVRSKPSFDARAASHVEDTEASDGGGRGAQHRGTPS